MKNSKKHSLSERNMEKKFANVENTQEGIQGVTVWAIHHRDQAEKIVDIWTKVFKKSSSPHTLTLMYCCNDIVQICKKKNAAIYKELFKQQLPDVISQMSQDGSVIAPVQRIFKIWSERLVYDEDMICELQDCLITDEVREKMQQDEIDKKLLAEFKPNKVVESLRGFRRLELDADMKNRQISNLRLDITNSDAIKQLKDRAHGSEYTKLFDDHSKRLMDFSSDLRKVMQERSALIELLELTEHFYELQYGEALVVANAYKNFGLRVNKQRKQVDDIMRTFPDSPIPSPSMDAPSPTGSLSPPDFLNVMPSQVEDMDMSDDERGESSQPTVVEEAYSPGSMDSAPSPEGSPLGLSLSPDATKEDMDIVKGRLIQPYDPTGADDYYQPSTVYSPPINVYNPKVHLDPRQKHNDLSARLQNLVQLRQVDSANSNDGEGTPTQDEFPDTRKRHAGEEYNPAVPFKKEAIQAAVKDKGDLDDMTWTAWEALEEGFNFKPNSETNTLKHSHILSALETVVAPNLSLNMLHRDLGQSHASPASTALIGQPVGVTPLGTAMVAPSNSAPSRTPILTAVPPVLDASLLNADLLKGSQSSPPPGGKLSTTEDANARAQREFLERLNQKGPLKASRYLQKLTQENEKKPSQPTRNECVSEVDAYSRMAVQTVSSTTTHHQTPAHDQGASRPKIEYRVAVAPRAVEAPLQSVRAAAPSMDRRHPPSPGGAVNYPPVSPAPAKPSDTPPAFPSVSRPGPLSGLPETSHYPPERSGYNQSQHAALMDQDMRHAHRTRPPPPPPFSSNAPNTPTPSVYSPSAQPPNPPPPPPDFARSFGCFDSSRMDRPPTHGVSHPPPWHGGPPPPGPPPSFFRPRF